MTVDYGQLTVNLHRFYDFGGKTVVFVGAGGGQLFDFSVRTKKIMAVDRDREAIAQLKARIQMNGVEHSVEVLCAHLEEVKSTGDVVYFEFCLHETDDPRKALKHAARLAPEIVVFDHCPGSEWAYHAAEDEKVACSAMAMEEFGIRRRETFCTTQSFETFGGLVAKIGTQGPVATERIQRFAGVEKIAIPMRYVLTLL